MATKKMPKLPDGKKYLRILVDEETIDLINAAYPQSDRDGILKRDADWEKRLIKPEVATAKKGLGKVTHSDAADYEELAETAEKQYKKNGKAVPSANAIFEALVKRYEALTQVK